MIDAGSPALDLAVSGAAAWATALMLLRTTWILPACIRKRQAREKAERIAYERTADLEQQAREREAALHKARMVRLARFSEDAWLSGARVTKKKIDQKQPRVIDPPSRPESNDLR